jgi:GH35 family endo-1,4-beta-xylanase
LYPLLETVKLAFAIPDTKYRVTLWGLIDMYGWIQEQAGGEGRGYAFPIYLEFGFSAMIS